LTRLNPRAPLIAALVLAAIAANADEARLDELLKTNTHQIALANARLSGPGADLMLELASKAQFVALGEEHDNYFIPAITTALFAAAGAALRFSLFHDGTGSGDDGTHVASSGQG
jgi:hypothetical protein